MKQSFAFGFILLLILANQASACSVCFSANENTRIAYYSTTAFLSFFPLLMLWLFARWIKNLLCSLESQN